MKSCEGSADKKRCFQEFLSGEIHRILSTDPFWTNTEIDSLHVDAVFNVNEQGEIIESLSYIISRDSLTPKELNSKLKDLCKSLPPFIIENKKPKEYSVKHPLEFTYLVTDDNTLSPVQFQTYEGGLLVEPPIYPGCESLLPRPTMICFQKQIINHIRQNFNYPKEAKSNGFEGKVYIIFKIGVNGYVEGIRTRGPHPLLEEEAKRIISLLPQMNPGKQNGNPVSTPFSIPIEFALTRRR